MEGGGGEVKGERVCADAQLRGRVEWEVGERGLDTEARDSSDREGMCV